MTRKSASVQFCLSSLRKPGTVFFHGRQINSLGDKLFSSVVWLHACQSSLLLAMSARGRRLKSRPTPIVHYSISTSQLQFKLCWFSSIFFSSAASLLPRMLARCTPRLTSARARALLPQQRFLSIPPPTSPPHGGSETKESSVESTFSSQETDIINRIALSEHAIVRGLGLKSWG